MFFKTISSKLIIIFFLFFFLPAISSAAGLSGLVTCADMNNCNFCDLLQTAKNILDFSVQLAFILVVAYTVWGGLQIMVSGAFESLYSKGRKLITNAAVGLVIILISWVFVDQMIRVMVGGSIFQGNFKEEGWVWNEIPCNLNKVDLPAFSGGTTAGNGASGSLGVDTSSCDGKALASRYSVPYPAKNSPEISDIVICINSKLSNIIDQSKIYTYERDNDLCNYNRGNIERNINCGTCAHKINSCHYGGSYGTTGALAVDFNAAFGTSESELNNEINKIARASECGINISNVLYETNHTHVSAPSCNSKY